MKGTGASGVVDTPGVHSKVRCIDCHMTETNHLMKVIRPDDPDLAGSRVDLCTACHKDSDRKTQASHLRKWDSIYSKQMQALQADMKYIRSAVKTDKEILKGDLKSKFERANINVMLLMRDCSHGAHNFEFATIIMSKARDDLDAVKGAIKYISFKADIWCEIFLNRSRVLIFLKRALVQSMR